MDEEIFKNVINTIRIGRKKEYVIRNIIRDSKDSVTAIYCALFIEQKGGIVMKANELLDKAIDFIVETQEQNDYICEQMCEEYVGDYCEKNCQNLNKECVKLFLQKVYNKA